MNSGAPLAISFACMCYFYHTSKKRAFLMPPQSDIGLLYTTTLPALPRLEKLGMPYVDEIHLLIGASAPCQLREIFHKRRKPTIRGRLLQHLHQLVLPLLIALVHDVQQFAHLREPFLAFAHLRRRDA